MKMNKLLTVVLGILLLVSCNKNKNELQNKDVNLKLEKEKIQTRLEAYKQSINQSDTLLAKTFWHTAPEVSFIHPRGHETGWNGVRKGIYEMFGTRFTERNLKSFDETITFYGDMAILEFYWIFDATFAGDDPKQVQTKGRETQVLKKIDSTWRIVHVHYSGMPATGEREGF